LLPVNVGVLAQVALAIAAVIIGQYFTGFLMELNAAQMPPNFPTVVVPYNMPRGPPPAVPLPKAKAKAKARGRPPGPQHRSRSSRE